MLWLYILLRTMNAPFRGMRANRNLLAEAYGRPDADVGKPFPKSLRLVHCKKCGLEYGYLINRGQGDDFVPCSQCGWVPRDMISTARIQYLSWLLWVGLLLAVVFLAVGGFGLRSWTKTYLAAGAVEKPSSALFYLYSALGYLGLIGVGMVVAKVVLSFLYNPNQDDPEYLKELGEMRSLGPKKLERMKETFGKRNILREG